MLGHHTKKCQGPKSNFGTFFCSCNSPSAPNFIQSIIASEEKLRSAWQSGGDLNAKLILECYCSVSIHTHNHQNRSKIANNEELRWVVFNNSGQLLPVAKAGISSALRFWEIETVSNHWVLPEVITHLEFMFLKVADQFRDVWMLKTTFTPLKSISKIGDLEHPRTPNSCNLLLQEYQNAWGSTI